MMFTLDLYYPDDSKYKGAVETIQSKNIPQIGQTIYGVRYYGAWIVAEIFQSVIGEVLNDTVGVILRRES